MITAGLPLPTSDKGPNTIGLLERWFIRRAPMGSALINLAVRLPPFKNLRLKSGVDAPVTKGVAMQRLWIRNLCQI